jgi:hypothetical protein
MDAEDIVTIIVNYLSLFIISVYDLVQDGLCAVVGPATGQVRPGLRGGGEDLPAASLRHHRLPHPGLPNHAGVSTSHGTVF